VHETNESFSERKQHTKVPALKNNISRRNKAFSERIRQSSSVDPENVHQVGQQMVLEFNLIAGQMLQLWHQLLETVQLQPRFVVSLLEADYEEKIRDKWSESIFRNVAPTPDFSAPSEENIGEVHKKLAKNRRANLLHTPSEQLCVEDLGLFAEQSVHPIIFEECYVKEQQAQLVQLVKSSLDLTEEVIHASKAGTLDDYRNYT